MSPPMSSVGRPVPPERTLRFAVEVMEAVTNLVLTEFNRQVDWPPAIGLERGKNSDDYFGVRPETPLTVLVHQ